MYRGYKPKESIDLHLKFGQKIRFNDESKFYDVNLPKEIKQQAMEQNLVKTSPRGQLRPEQIGDPKELQAIEDAQKNCEVIFDSMFESGNLDIAIQV